MAQIELDLAATEALTKAGNRHACVCSRLFSLRSPISLNAEKCTHQQARNIGDAQPAGTARSPKLTGAVCSVATYKGIPHAHLNLFLYIQINPAVLSYIRSLKSPGLVQLQSLISQSTTNIQHSITMKTFQYAAVAALAAGASATTTASTTETSAYPTGSGFFGSSLDSSQSSALSSYKSAHPNGPSSSDWASFTSAASISGGVGFFGGATPTGSFATRITGAPSGFPGAGSGHGGFGGGHGGPFGGGSWGAGPFGSSGAWTNGPWTSWFGGSACPASDWPGWTSGTWSTSAPWTSWTGCSASVTATSVYTTSTSISGSEIPTTSTSFGYKVAQASGTSSASSTPSSGAGKVAAGGAAAAALVGALAML